MEAIFFGHRSLSVHEQMEVGEIFGVTGNELVEITVDALTLG